MNHRVQNKIVNYIWSIADDVLRDVFVRGKYRDIILPFTVLRRIDVLLEDTKEQVLKANNFLDEQQITEKSSLENITHYPFYNTSPFTMAKNSSREAEVHYASLMSDPDNIDTNLETYLDGFSPNIQEIISKFKIRNQLETMKDAGLTFALIEKLTASTINLSPNDVVTASGERLPGLTNHGMGYVFEELVRKFNEENNEEAGEHFTPREIIRLMTHIIFEPVKDKLKEKEGARFTIYDPACGSGGMLTEAEDFAKRITENGCEFSLFGQEVNSETWAICTGDMLIKGEKVQNIQHASTLSKDGFPGNRFDFMLTNPPYGKSWKIDEDTIVDNRGNKNKQRIKDPRFRVGLPSISDGQLLFLLNMISKMKNTELGSRIASIHNGSALFTGDAGQGESEIRKMIIENDYLECIIALPTNIFYNTGIPTYVWILSNRKETKRQGKIQLINATELYTKLRKNLGQKNCELTKEHIRKITQLYMDFEETEISKIFNNEDFGYQKITVERPLRLTAKITDEAIETLRFHNAIKEEAEQIYHKYPDDVYKTLKPYKKEIEKRLEDEDINLSNPNKKKLFDIKIWHHQKELMKVAKLLQENLGEEEHKDFNSFKKQVDKILKSEEIKIKATDLQTIFNAITQRDETAEPVIKKKEKNGKIIYEPDSELRDTENVPLSETIQDYFEREVKPYVPDAWIDHTKTQTGYSISFTRYFYKYKPPRSLEEIANDLEQLQAETEGLLEEFLND